MTLDKINDNLFWEILIKISGASSREIMKNESNKYKQAINTMLFASMPIDEIPINILFITGKKIM